MRNTPLKAFAKANSQNLSDKALRDKRQRDKAAAMTNKRKDRKSDGTVVKMSIKNNRDVFKHGER